MRGEGSLCCDTICSGSEYCKEHRSNRLQKQKRVVDLRKEEKHVLFWGFCYIPLVYLKLAFIFLFELSKTNMCQVSEG